MHTVVVRCEVANEQPWILRELLDAFRLSKRLAFEEMRDPRRISLAWLREALAEQEEVLGPDPWAYEFGANVSALTTLIRYAHEQGLIRRPFPAEELFAASTLEDLPSYV